MPVSCLIFDLGTLAYFFSVATIPGVEILSENIFFSKSINDAVSRPSPDYKPLLKKLLENKEMVFKKEIINVRNCSLK